MFLQKGVSCIFVMHLYREAHSGFFHQLVVNMGKYFPEKGKGPRR